MFLAAPSEITRSDPIWVSEIHAGSPVLGVLRYAAEATAVGVEGWKPEAGSWE